jgi:assimilatory nitrate reductase catalytic subunit
VRRFWRAERVAEKPGLKAVELFEAIAAGRIKALWIMATNPVDSMPDADTVRRRSGPARSSWCRTCHAATDTAVEAHVRLPAAGWGEKDGTVTNSERRISRQRPFLRAPGEARPDWWIVTQVARRMGHAEAFAYERPAEIFAEHAALSGFENEGSRDFDLSGLMHADYDGLQPVQWPVRAVRSTARMFTDARFFTP